MAAKRKASAMNGAENDEPVDPADELIFYGLGGCNEVGRSCHILQYKGKTVMVSLMSSLLIPSLTMIQLDAGMHTGKEGFAALPFLDDFDLSTVDILLISQYVLPSSLCVFFSAFAWCCMEQYMRPAAVWRAFQNHHEVFENELCTYRSHSKNANIFQKDACSLNRPLLAAQCFLHHSCTYPG